MNTVAMLTVRWVERIPVFFILEAVRNEVLRYDVSFQVYMNDHNQVDFVFQLLP